MSFCCKYIRFILLLSCKLFVFLCIMCIYVWKETFHRNEHLILFFIPFEIVHLSCYYMAFVYWYSIIKALYSMFHILLESCYLRPMSQHPVTYSHIHTVFTNMKFRRLIDIIPMLLLSHYTTCIQLWRTWPHHGCPSEHFNCWTRLNIRVEHTECR